MMLRSTTLLLGLVLGVPPARPAEAADGALESLGPVRIVGKIEPGEKVQQSVSGVGVVGEFLLLAADESKRGVSVLRRSGDGYVVPPGALLGLPRGPDEDADEEFDLEAIAVEGRRVFVVASHARTRGKKPQPDQPLARNRARLLQKPGPSQPRDRLFVLDLDPRGGPAGPIQRWDLAARLDADPLLGPFRALPGKEGGIDIEGLAVRGGKLYVGFRGPVIRGRWAVVLRCDARPELSSPELLFVNLGGRGIRDLAVVSDGLLVVGGPVGEGGDGFGLYHWNGHDTLPGSGGPAERGRVSVLAELSANRLPRPEVQVEGLAVLAENEASYELLVCFDGLPNGGPHRYRVAKRKD